MRAYVWTGTALALSFAAGLWLQGNAVAQEPKHDHAVTAAKPATESKAPTTAKLAPHRQATLPPLELPAYQLPRSPEVVRAAYKFAAEHPEVLSYVPCFCGCENSGHQGNEDCFVKTRAKNGDVTAWQEHG